MDLKSSFEQINVVDIDVHPFYSKFSYLEYDVAVLHLERESEASAITLDSGINLEAGEDMKAIVSCSLLFVIINMEFISCSVKGFGEADDDYGVIFREVDLLYVTNEQCKTDFFFDDSFLTESMMCAWRREASICFVSFYFIFSLNYYLIVFRRVTVVDPY